jgi:hypothetical protein
MEEYFEIINSVTDNLIEIIGDEKLVKPILELSSDVIDTAIPGFNIALKLTQKVRILKFKSFLKGINKLCLKNHIEGKSLAEKLIKLSEKKLYKEFIYQTYESAVAAKSIKNTAILGYYLAQNAFFNKTINMEQTIICNALKELTDLESEIFIYIHDCEYKKFENDLTYFDSRDIKIKKYDDISIQMVVEQLKNLRIFGRGIGSFEFSEQHGICIFTEITNKFYELLNEVNIIEN